MRAVPLLLICIVLIIGGILAFAYMQWSPASPVIGSGRVISNIGTWFRSKPIMEPPIVYERDGAVYVARVCNIRDKGVSSVTASASLSTSGTLIVENGTRRYESDLCNPKVLTIVADPSSFRIVPAPDERNRGYFQDDHAVYYSRFVATGNDAYYATNTIEIIRDADPKTFTLTPYGIATDTRAVYYLNELLPDLDPATFSSLGNSIQGFFKDKNGVYEFLYEQNADKPIFTRVVPRYPDGTIAAPIDAMTFSYEGASIYKDKNTRYVVPSAAYARTASLVALYPIDAASFQALADSDYAIDERHVYFNMHFIPGADPQTFELMRGSLMSSKYDSIHFRYARDNRTIYFDGIALPDADIATLRPIENGLYQHSYAVDARTVYYGAQPIIRADPATFQILWRTIPEGCIAGSYAKDAIRVYYEAVIIEGADVATFKPVEYSDGQYGKDVHGYWDGTKFIGQTVDPKKLECSYG